MRIGIDIREAEPRSPGQQRYLWRMGSWLAAAGHDVHYLTVKRQAPTVTAPRGTTLHQLHRLNRKGLRRAVTDLRLDAFLINPERSRRYRGIEANVLRSAYGTEHYRQKLRSFRSPLEQGLRKIWRTAPWIRLEQRWERAFYEGTEPPPHVIAQSRYMRQQILESYRIPPDHVHVIHNAIDTSEFSPEARLARRRDMRARWGVPDDAFCLLFLGHNFRLKGLWQLLRVLGGGAGMTGGGAGESGSGVGPDRLHLLVAGKGTGSGQRRKAERLIRHHGLEGRVTLAGAVQPSMEALAAADALVHLSWHDSFGFAALEAMACGLPVITTPYAGASELLEDGVSGLIVDPDDDAAVASAIEMLRDEGTRRRMGDAAAAMGTKQTEPSNFLQVLGVIEQAVRERGRPVG